MAHWLGTSSLRSRPLVDSLNKDQVASIELAPENLPCQGILVKSFCASSSALLFSYHG